MLLSLSGSQEISPSLLRSSSKVLMDSSAGFMPYLGEIPVLNFNDSGIRNVSTFYLFFIVMYSVYSKSHALPRSRCLIKAGFLSSIVGLE